MIDTLISSFDGLQVNVQRSQARQRVLTQRSLGKETFLAIVAAVPEPLSKRSSRQKSGDISVGVRGHPSVWRP